MSAEEQLKKLGLTLPAPPKAVGAYVTYIRTGNLVFTSGQLPWKDGKLAYEGKVGSDLTVEQGYDAARISAVNALAQLKAATGDLEKVVRIIRLEGYVNCAPGFTNHSEVLNGGSELLAKVLGQRGVHTRTAVGSNELPLNTPVELILIAEVRD